jgi:hypothetical protein
MGKQVAFTFYPAEYIRQTRRLSPHVQVAYDGIMCVLMEQPHGLTPAQYNHHTKRLSGKNKEQINELLIKDENGNYTIKWITDSMNKQQAYSQSRRANRMGIAAEKLVVEQPPVVVEPKPEPPPQPIEPVVEPEPKPVPTRVRKPFVPPTPQEVQDYFESKGFDADLANKAWGYYDVANWKDSTGKQVLNWKQKMISVWMREENRPNRKLNGKPTRAEQITDKADKLFKINME